MRRAWITLCSIVFTTLAVIGGPTGAMLCLHESGVFHLSSLFEAEHDSPTAGEGHACDTTSTEHCKWCIDVEVKGLDLAETRLEDAEAHFVFAPVFVGAIPIQEWAFPTALSSSLPLLRGPPTLPGGLFVTETTVLLI